ncbi:MAG: hypothetical protein KKB50_19430 [Planctomycetes bacterium]|nr:hypothetical protein [Planctomycetota bacterium]
MELDTSHYPPPMVAMLMARGAELLPLQWHLNPSRAAKGNLDELTDDQRLFGVSQLADEPMGAAVRALLYLWNGWPAEAEMYAELAEERERTYVVALCKRQVGDPAGAKERFQGIADHPVFRPLAEYAIKTIGLSTARALKRLREVIAFGEQWEPHAFTDVYEQARDGQLDPAGEKIVRQLQRREFELLFQFCMAGAVGEALTARRAAPPKQSLPVRPRTPSRAPRRTPAKSSSVKTTHLLDPVSVGVGVHVLCPKCNHKLVFPETTRGCAGKCDQCGIAFLVPQR